MNNEENDKMTDSEANELAGQSSDPTGVRKGYGTGNSDLSYKEASELRKALSSDTPVIVNMEGRGEIHSLGEFVSDGLPPDHVNEGEPDIAEGIRKGLVKAGEFAYKERDNEFLVVKGFPTDQINLEPEDGMEPSAKTIDEVKDIMEGWKEETKIPEPVKKEVKPYCMIDVKDVEKHGFKLQPRGKSTDPFTYRKWIMIAEAAGQDTSWEEHGYCVQLTMLMPLGRTFINVLGPEHVYLPEKCDMSICPCHFDGVVFRAEELELVIEMALRRDPIFVFDPTEEVPHQNFWVELARNQVNTKPVKN